MRSSRFVVSLSLVLFAPLGFAQNKPQTEAQQDGLIGAVKSVSTIVENTEVSWQPPNGPTLVIPAYCRDCEYTADGYRTKSGLVADGKFLGETITLNRDGSGRVKDRETTNTVTSGPSRHEVLGPFGKIEQTVYEDGKIKVHQTFSYDGSGNLLETISRDVDGALMGRTLTTRSTDGAWSDETWGKDERVEAMNSYNPAADEQRSTNFDESGNVTQTWTFAQGKVTSFWESPHGPGQSGTTLSDFSDKANVRAFQCHGGGQCEPALVHYEYADAAKQNPLSAEWRDAGGNLLYAAYYTYQFDQSGNWTHREVWVSSANAGERVLYETDNRLITYWEN
jgi:hypothetical protein